MKKLKHIIVLLVLFSTSCQKEKIENPNSNITVYPQLTELYIDSAVYIDGRPTIIFTNVDSITTGILYVYKQIIGIYCYGECFSGPNSYIINNNQIISEFDSSIVYYRKYRQGDYIKINSCY